MTRPALDTHAEALAAAYPAATEQAWRWTLRRLLSCADPRRDGMYRFLDSLGTSGLRARAWIIRERQERALAAGPSLPPGVQVLCAQGCGQWHEGVCA